MKKLLFKSLIVGLAILTLQIQSISAKENKGITLTINGQLQHLEQNIIIKDDRTLVPLRGIFENLGIDIQWNDQTHMITAQKDDSVIILTIGDKEAYVNNKKIVLDIPAQIVNGRTLVPIRFIGEALDKHVYWDSLNKIISITDIVDFIKKEPKEESSNINPRKKNDIFNKNISLGVSRTIPIENSLLNLDNLVILGSGGDNILRLSGEGILYIDRDHTNNPGYHEGFDIYLAKIEVISDLRENGLPISAIVHNKEITKVGGGPFSSNTKGKIWVGITFRGESEVFAITEIEVDIP